MRRAYTEEQFQAAVPPILQHLEAALGHLQGIADLARQGRIVPRRLEWGTHQTYLRERVQDVRIIIERLVAGKREFAELHAQRPPDDHGGALDVRVLTLPTQMKLDYEALYIFGNQTLDQLAMLAFALTGEQPVSGRDPDFHEMMQTLQHPGYAGPLASLWDRHRCKLVWIYYQVRRVRNRFVEHLRNPLQRTQTMTFYGADFDLFMPRLPQVGAPPATDEATQAQIREFGRRAFLHIPPQEWNEYGFPYVLKLVFDFIDHVESWPDREVVWSACVRHGIQVPSYHVVAFRLAQLLDECLGTLTEIAAAVGSHDIVQ